MYSNIILKIQPVCEYTDCKDTAKTGLLNFVPIIEVKNIKCKVVIEDCKNGIH